MRVGLVVRFAFQPGVRFHIMDLCETLVAEYDSVHAKSTLRRTAHGQQVSLAHFPPINRSTRS